MHVFMVGSVHIQDTNSGTCGQNLTGHTIIPNGFVYLLLLCSSSIARVSEGHPQMDPRILFPHSLAYDYQNVATIFFEHSVV